LGYIFEILEIFRLEIEFIILWIFIALRFLDFVFMEEFKFLLVL